MELLKAATTMTELLHMVGAGRQAPPPCGWKITENVRSSTEPAPKRIEIGS